MTNGLNYVERNFVLLSGCIRVIELKVMQKRNKSQLLCLCKLTSLEKSDFCVVAQVLKADVQLPRGVQFCSLI